VSFNDLGGEETEKIVRLKLSDQVLDKLRLMIRSGELRQGDYMPSERALMDRFGVGRPAVREAMQSLQNQGLITINQGERSRVRELSAATVLDQSDDVARLLLDAAPANLEHLKQARRMFELGIVRVAADKATPEDIGDLRALLEEQRGHLKDPKKFIGTDMRFHTRIAEITDNPIIVAASSAMLRWLLEYHVSLLHWSGKEKVTLQEHGRIIERIEAHDADAATAEMQRHLDRSNALFTPRPVEV
jgi:DNA-binding FadR family transcriptional regulator